MASRPQRLAKAEALRVAYHAVQNMLSSGVYFDEDVDERHMDRIETELRKVADRLWFRSQDAAERLGMRFVHPVGATLEEAPDAD